MQVTAVIPTYNRADIAFERGEGPYLYDEKGARYLDFGTGLAVSALGHAHPRLIAALTEQAGKLWHTSNLYRIPGQETLAEKLVAKSFADTVFFTNSGAEALECAIKMARKYQSATGHPEKFRIITFEGAFHGRTLATIAAGGQAKYLEGFGPRVEGFDQVPFGDHEALKLRLPDTRGLHGMDDVNPAGWARVSYVRDLPDGRRFANDSRGLLYLIDANNQTHVYADVGAAFPYGVYNRLESGFIGFAFHPDFARNGLFYTVHSEKGPGNPKTPDFIPIGYGLKDVSFHNVITEWHATNPAARFSCRMRSTQRPGCSKVLKRTTAPSTPTKVR